MSIAGSDRRLAVCRGSLALSPSRLRRRRRPRGGAALRRQELRQVGLQRLVRRRADVDHVARLVIAERDALRERRIVAEMPEVDLRSEHGVAMS